MTSKAGAKAARNRRPLFRACTQCASYFNALDTIKRGYMARSDSYQDVTAACFASFACLLRLVKSSMYRTLSDDIQI